MNLKPSLYYSLLAISILFESNIACGMNQDNLGQEQWYLAKRDHNQLVQDHLGLMTDATRCCANHEVILAFWKKMSGKSQISLDCLNSLEKRLVTQIGCVNDLKLEGGQYWDKSKLQIKFVQEQLEKTREQLAYAPQQNNKEQVTRLSSEVHNWESLKNKEVGLLNSIKNTIADIQRLSEETEILKNAVDKVQKALPQMILSAELQSALNQGEIEIE